MNLRRILGVCCLFLILTTGAAMADYQSSNDKTISVTAAPTLLQFGGNTAAYCFALQEYVHSLITSTTGQSIPHYYFWVTVNGTSMCGIDPVWVDVH